MWVADGRLGMWAAGRQRFDEADVWMLVGTNPFVSLQPPDFTGVPMHDPRRRVQEARRRGLKLIVVDPRRTEVASEADIHLQLRPGTDVVLFAGFLHLLLRDGHDDRDFCERWVDGLDDLRVAVEGCGPDVVARVCGVPRGDLEAAARLFGRARSGMAMSGTGPDMGPWSNLAEHLIRSLNVVCGRFPRDGDRAAGESVLGSPKAPPGMAISPDRTWERGYRSRLGYGTIKHQLPSASLPFEILEEGPGRIRALFVSGANPAAAIPDMDLAVEALSSLDLLVTVDPFLTETAQLAHYVIAPVMHLERPDTTRVYEANLEVPFAQYTPAVLEAPPDVVDDWEFWLRLAWEQGHTVTVAGRDYAPGGDIPATDEVLASFATRGQVPLDEVRRHPHGAVFDDVARRVVGPPNEAAGRFELLAPDVAAELEQAWGELTDTETADRRPRLVVRRVKQTVNSLGKQIPGLSPHPYNPCFVHPDDLAALGLSSGDDAVLTSDHGSIEAVVEADVTMRRGSVSMTHAFGSLGGGDHREVGSNTTRLLSLVDGIQTINAMPQMSAIPVTITPL
jgi:anaerobic selenocysteine-containing dehydrogenase